MAQAIMRHLAEDGRSTLDLELDAPWLATYTTDVDDVLYRMARQGLAHRIQKGRYVINTDNRSSRTARLDALDVLAPVILNRLGHQWYLSWHSALWHYGLVDQQASRLYVAVRARKRPARAGRNEVRFVTVSPRKFFGWETIEAFGQTLHMATVEKAIVDSLDQPRLAAPISVVANAMRSAWQEGSLDPAQLIATAMRFDSPVLNRRLGFFMDLYGIPGTEELALHIGRKSAVPLTPGRQPELGAVRVNPRWLVYEDPAIVTAAQGLRG